MASAIIYRPPWLWRAFSSGPILMALATLSFCIMAAAVKVARQEMEALEIIAWRGAISIPLAFFFAWPSGFRLHRIDLLLMRAMLGFGAMFCFFTATKGLALADMSLITRLQPVIIAFIAPLALGANERTGPLIWLALVVGLAGCAILIGPGLAVGNRFGLWALVATVASAAAHTVVRALGRTENPRSVVFWFQLSNLPFAIAACLLIYGELPQVPQAHLIAPVVTCGLAATVGQLLMTRAYQQEQAAIVAAASYAGPIWSVLLDLFIFGLVPGWEVAAGGVLVVAAGYLLYRGRG
ncbi:MAG: DMT family transporter [Myxococcota bacterium]